MVMHGWSPADRRFRPGGAVTWEHMFDWEAAMMHPPEHPSHRPAAPAHRDEQMTLFAHATRPTGSRRRMSRNERMALRLEQLANEWDDGAADAHAAGDQLTERRLREQARDARRSAQVLRAGPGGAAGLLAS
jgi:hypothetical protein